MRLRPALASPAALLMPLTAEACGRCAPLVRLDVFDAAFMAKMLVLLVPLAVILLATWAIARLDLFD